MDSLPDFISFDYHEKKAMVLHGSIDETAEFIFNSTPWHKKKKIIEQAQADLVLAGHCGLPFSEEIENKHWINAGVIGMPANDSTQDVWYVILEMIEEKLHVTHHRMKYDHGTAARLMEVNRLPSEYSNTLKTGIWDNCDILPEEETALQGQKITLQ